MTGNLGDAHVMTSNYVVEGWKRNLFARDTTHRVTVAGCRGDGANLPGYLAGIRI
jgi:hypothetical protein